MLQMVCPMFSWQNKPSEFMFIFFIMRDTVIKCNASLVFCMQNICFLDRMYTCIFVQLLRTNGICKTWKIVHVIYIYISYNYYFFGTLSPSVSLQDISYTTSGGWNRTHIFSISRRKYRNSMKTCCFYYVIQKRVNKR